MGDCCPRARKRSRHLEQLRERPVELLHNQFRHPFPAQTERVSSAHSRIDSIVRVFRHDRVLFVAAVLEADLDREGDVWDRRPQTLDEDGDELTMLFDFPTMQAMYLGLARRAMDKADAQKVLTAGTRRNFVSNSLVMIVPTDSTLALITLSFANRSLTFTGDGGGQRASYIVTVDVMQGTNTVRHLEAHKAIRVASFHESQREDESVIFQQFMSVPPGTRRILAPISSSSRTLPDWV